MQKQKNRNSEFCIYMYVYLKPIMKHKITNCIELIGKHLNKQIASNSVHC